MRVAVKWSGSKRSQAKEILSFFPKQIDTYFEPFCGGCSMLGELMKSTIKVKNFVCCDINHDLISLWNMIKDNPENLLDGYTKLWNQISYDNNIERKKTFYNKIRSEFNEDRNSIKFLFLLRTCANGLIRYNKKGEFNTPFHLTRNGINPSTLTKIIYEWSELLNEKNVSFLCCDYSEITPCVNDFMYLDPPYFNTKGMYQGKMNFDNLWNFLKGTKTPYALSFDGISGGIDNTYYDIPDDIYDECLKIKSGNSSFKRLFGNNKEAVVYEMLYVRK